MRDQKADSPPGVPTEDRAEGAWDGAIGEVLRCSVVIPTCRRSEQLRRCLAALSDLPEVHEVLVVDNTAGDSAAREAAISAGARYMSESSGSLSRARTVGAREARGAIVAFIDDDAAASSGWLAGHLRAFADPSVAATTGRVIPLETPMSESKASVAPGENPTAFCLDRDDPDWFERANFGGLGSGGANMAFRRDLFVAGWGFHEDLGPPLPMGGEEHFALFELLRAGWRVEYVPEAVVMHPAIIGPDDVVLGFASGGEAGIDKYRRRLFRGSGAYMIFLLVEARGFRRATLSYMVGSVRGAGRDWRPGPAGEHKTSRLRLIRYSLAAPWAYLRSRHGRRERLPRKPPPAGPLV